MGSDRSALRDVCARIHRPRGAQRIGQALWMLVGERVNAASLLWARSHLGEDGNSILMAALREGGCLTDGDVLQARPLAEFLCLLWDAPAQTEVAVLWTLPRGWATPGVDESGYVTSVLKLISQAHRRLLLVAPFIEPRGIGMLQRELLAALTRDVAVRVVTQDATSLGSWASQSLDSLRQEARGLPGRLTVFTAREDAGGLLHSKIVVADGTTAIVGSANLTANALSQNLETGVRFGAVLAADVERVIQGAIDAGTVTRAFGAS